MRPYTLYISMILVTWIQQLLLYLNVGAILCPDKGICPTKIKLFTVLDMELISLPGGNICIGKLVVKAVALWVVL